MDLIDWPYVVCNALWILGLSVALAAWSYLSWWAWARGQRLRQALSLPLFVVPLSAGMLMFSVGMSWGAAHGGERALWAGLALWFAWEIVSSVRRAHREGWSGA
jgi:hypothetical protein